MDPCDTPLGLNIPARTKAKLKRLALEVEEAGRKATMQDVLVVLIESATAASIVDEFPQRQRRR
jgi:hypothetical protein